MLRSRVTSDAALEFLSEENPEFCLDEALFRVRDAIGCKHVIYHAARLGAGAVDDPFIRLTYPSDWVKRYLTNGYMRVDPVIREGFQRTAPFEWSEVEPCGDEEEAFFLDALAFGVGNNGFSIPVRDKRGRRALFTISSDLANSEWELFLRTHRARLIDIAHKYHERAVLEQEGEISYPPLTKREREVLYWAAQGKTAIEIGMILSLSESTAATYLRSARYKLNSSSIAQAVYKAQQLGLVENMAKL